MGFLRWLECVFEIYESDDGQIRSDVQLEGETVWLSIGQMSTLFGRDKSTISRHIKKIYDEEELDEVTTVAYFATVQNEGSREVEREIACYNLDVIISPRINLCFDNPFWIYFSHPEWREAKVRSTWAKKDRDDVGYSNYALYLTKG